MKLKLGALIIGAGLIISLPVYIQAQGMPIVHHSDKEKRDRQRFEQEREEQKKMQEEKETRASDARQEESYEESRKARIKKIEKQSGKKVKSWQLLNR